MFEATDFETEQLYTGPARAYVEQDREDAAFVSLRAFTGLAPNDTQDTMEFIRHEIVTNDAQWLRRCLSLQRQARQLPAVYPTAISAMVATPKSERVPFKDAKRGMIGFSYDPRIPGTAGHVFSIHGENKNGIVVTGSNDVRAPGEVNYVPLGFYEKEWGQTLTFAATCLNGYDFSDFNKPPEPIKQGTLGERYENAMEELEKIERQKRAKGYDKMADAIARDIARMKRKLERWGE